VTASCDVICLVERDGASAADASLRVLSFAVSLASGGRVSAVVFPPSDGGGSLDADDPVAAQLVGAGVSDVCLVRSAELFGYAPAAWARSLAQLAADGHASAVVAAATDRGSEVLAHLGAMMGLAVATNCVAAESSAPGTWRLVRQRWAGSVLEDAELAASCALLTVASDALAAGSPAAASADSPVVDGVVGDGAVVHRAVADRGVQARAAVRSFTPVLTASDLQVRATESEEQSSGVSLATARVVVGGGRGVGGPDGFAALEELAGLLGGVVGVSRVVTSQGWRPHRQQVGQTGTKISPELYLACGISGAIQHMAGCLSAKHIVAVNTDADAPIIAHAEYAVIGDLNEVVPALVAAIRSRSG
jgi:electron transfer flavoprotein alpha subunit